MRSEWIVGAVVVGLLAAVPGRVAAPPHRDPVVAPLARGAMNETMPGLVLVKFRPSVAARAAAARRFPVVADATQPESAPSAGLTYQSRIAATGWTMWRVDPKTDVPALVARLKGAPGVITAQPVNRVYPLLDTPDDPDWDAQETSPDLILNFSENEISFRRLWHLDEISAFDAWSDWPNQWYTAADKPTDGPLIAVIDTGCDIDHPDFINAGGTGTDVSEGGQFENSLNAQFTLGEIVPGGDPTDTMGHGTHVTGLALAAGNNGGFTGHGVIGTGYNARGMVLRVFDEQGVGTDADAAAAIFYAADNGAEIINLSLGTTNFSQLFQDAVTYAFQKGSLVVCAANERGSGGGEIGPNYPAACSGALAVTASGPDFSSAASVYAGSGNYIDCAAPGGSVVQAVDYTIIQYVYSTATRYPCTLTDLSAAGVLYPPYTQNYSYLAGTSMATPLVAGAAALYYGKFDLHQNDGWTNVRTYRSIERSALGTGPLGTWENTFGYGILNMALLLAEENPRAASVGGIEGIVYYNTTALANVRMRAVMVGTTRQWVTTTRPDGGYRFEALPPGRYNVTAAPFGAKKTRVARVDVGSDLTGFDFFCGSYTEDETAPTVPKFSATMSGNTITLHHWGYDTETGIDTIRVRIGTSMGANDIMTDTIVVPDSNTIAFPGLSLVAGNTYYVRGSYTNGGGLVTTVDFRIGPAGPTVKGQIALEGWLGGQVPVIVELRTPGTQTVVERHNVIVAPNGSYSFFPKSAGTFDVAAKGSHWLRQRKSSVVIPAGTLNGLNFALINGDVDNDNQVTLKDASLVSNAYGTAPGQVRWNPEADVDGDGLVDRPDYNLTRANYRKKGDP